MLLIKMNGRIYLPVDLAQSFTAKIAQVSADGANNIKGCYQLLRRKGCKDTIPPRSNAGLWEKGHSSDEAVEVLKAGQLKQWKIDNGYHQCFLTETAMSRYKQLNSPMLSLRDYNAQVSEALAGVKAKNKVVRLGKPVHKQVAQSGRSLGMITFYEMI